MFPINTIKISCTS